MNVSHIKKDEKKSEDKADELASELAYDGLIEKYAEMVDQAYQTYKDTVI